ncbi:MAG: hypothetical protein EA423_10815 [Phycisphaerales bacterium]|nr:MAG: hypothetical protein EA423_10815 [Phycisphaerales bacterium]
MGGGDRRYRARCMITRISGRLAGVDGLSITIDLEGGLAYEVLTPTYLAEQLASGRLVEGSRIGGGGDGRITLWTLQYLEAQGQGSSFIPRLVGFASPDERRFFTVFTTVKGLGNRKALRALAVPPAQIASAIQRKDTAALQKLPEIGKRLADTIVAELSGKIAPFLDASLEKSLESASVAEAKPLGGPASEAVDALVALGETRAEAERKVARAIERLEPEADASTIVAAAFGAS